MKTKYKVSVNLWYINKSKIPKWLISIDNEPITLKQAEKLLSKLESVIDKFKDVTGVKEKEDTSTFCCDRCEKTSLKRFSRFAHGNRCSITGDCDECCKMLCSTCHEAVLLGGSLEKDEDQEVGCESCGVMISECDVDDIRLCDDCNEKLLEGN